MREACYVCFQGILIQTQKADKENKTMLLRVTVGRGKRDEFQQLMMA